MLKKSIIFSLAVWGLMGSAELWAVPSQCVGVKSALGDSQQNLAPFLQQQRARLTKEGTVLDLVDYLVNQGGIATDIIPDAGKLLASLTQCVDWFEQSGSPEDKKNLPTIYFAQVLAAQSLLLQARSSGDGVGMRYAARQLEKAAEQREAVSPNLSMAENTRLKTAKDLASQIVNVESVRSDADVVVVVRNTLNKLLRPGVSQGEVFYSYLQRVNEPIYLVMKLLTDAAIAKERALALMTRSLGTGESEPPNQPDTAVCDAYDCDQLTEQETELLSQAYKSWQSITKKAAPTHTRSSYTRLVEKRTAYKNAEARKNIDNSHPPCFYEASADKPAESNCIPIPVFAAGKVNELSAWDRRYIYADLPETLQQSLLTLIPLRDMDTDIKSVATLLSPAMESDALVLQPKYQEPAKTLLGTIATWSDERLPLPLVSASSGETLGLEPSLLKAFGLTADATLKEVSFFPSKAARESRLSFVSSEVCSNGDQLSELEGLLHKPLKALREELDKLLSSEGFDKACATVSTYIQSTVSSTESGGSGG